MTEETPGDFPDAVTAAVAQGLTLGEKPGTADPIPADAPPGDTYSREQAARLLSLSPRRITQLAQDGRLETVQANPLRLDAASVHAERDRRRSPGRDMRATVPAPETSVLIAEQVAQVAAMLEQGYRRQIEMGEALLAETQAERDRLRDDLTAERERADRDRERLQAEITAERERTEAERKRADEVAAARRRRWWHFRSDA